MKLVALDLDGTLLNAKEIIGPRNVAAIKSLQDKGIVVTIATGRSFREAQDICALSGVDPYIISSNGAEINDRKGAPLAGFAIERSLALELTKWLEENEYYYELTGDAEVYAVKATRDRHQENFEQFKRQYPDPVHLTKGIGLEYKLSFRKIGITDTYQDIFAQEKNIFKIHVLSPCLDRLAIVKDKFRKLKQLEIVSSLDHNIEVMNCEVSKGASVKKLAELLGLSLENTMAIGDNYNDLSMLKVVKYPVAMGNAKAEVKAICKYTTLRDHEDGVAHAIERFDEIVWE